jgi:hypothetical protein
MPISHIGARDQRRDVIPINLALAIVTRSRSFAAIRLRVGILSNYETTVRGCVRTGDIPEILGRYAPNRQPATVYTTQISIRLIITRVNDPVKVLGLYFAKDLVNIDRYGGARL